MTVWVLLLITSVVVPALFVFVLIRLMVGAKMGLSRATDAFNNVAVKVESLVDLGRLDERVAQDIIESVINSLTQDLDWDTVDDSIREFKSTPFIVQAFENCGYKLIEDE